VSDTFADLRRARVLPFGGLPVLEDDDFRLAQGPVILAYLAHKHGLVGDDPRLRARADSIAWGAEDLRIRYFEMFGGADDAANQAKFVAGAWTKRWLPSFDVLLGDREWFVGDALTHADVAVFDAVQATVEWVGGATLDGFPRVAALIERVRARPRIAAYLAGPRRAKG
jgi:glutathione S-transferase